MHDYHASLTPFNVFKIKKCEEYFKILRKATFYMGYMLI